MAAVDLIAQSTARGYVTAECVTHVPNGPQVVRIQIKTPFYLAQ